MGAVLVGLGVTAAGASAATISWSAPVLVDHQQPFATTPSIEQVACPSARLCDLVNPYRTDSPSFTRPG